MWSGCLNIVVTHLANLAFKYFLINFHPVWMVQTRHQSHAPRCSTSETLESPDPSLDPPHSSLITWALSGSPCRVLQSNLVTFLWPFDIRHKITTISCNAPVVLKNFGIRNARSSRLESFPGTRIMWHAPIRRIRPWKTRQGKKTCS